jgi:ferredoxin-type protein NapH
MGIDVRAYAQRNESFTRASCVGCGMCAHMCPRGVLKLENTTAPRRVTKRGSLPIVSG